MCVASLFAFLGKQPVSPARSGALTLPCGRSHPKQGVPAKGGQDILAPTVGGRTEKPLPVSMAGETAVRTAHSGTITARSKASANWLNWQRPPNCATPSVLLEPRQQTRSQLRGIAPEDRRRKSPHAHPRRLPARFSLARGSTLCAFTCLAATLVPGTRYPIREGVEALAA
jgi:hypothetical protein